MATSDCSDCPVFVVYVRGAKLSIEWVCSVCIVGRRDAWEGVQPERLLGGLYRAGTCGRCLNARILLMPVYFQ